MSQKYLFLPGLVMFLLLFSGVARAGDKEADELRGRAAQLMREVQELRDQGKNDAARRLEMEIQKIGERAAQTAAEQDRKPGPGEQVAQHIRQLREKLGEASQAGQSEVAERLQGEIRDQVQKAVRQAEETAKRQMEGMQKKIDQLRKEGQSEAADRLSTHMQEMMQSYKQRAVKWREALTLPEQDQRPEQAKQQRRRAEEQPRRERQADQRRQQQAEKQQRDFQQRAEEMEREARELHERGEQVAQQLQAMVQQREREAQERDRQQAEQEQRDFQQRVEEMEREARELHERGEHVTQQLREMVQQHEREAQKRDSQRHEIQSRDAEREVRERREMEPRGDREPSPIGLEKRADLERRVHHLRTAAENLAAIGMQDMVERLQSEADEIQRLLQPPREPGEGPHQGVMETIRREFEAISERLNAFDRRLDELTETVRRAHQDRR